MPSVKRFQVLCESVPPFNSCYNLQCFKHCLLASGAS